VVPESELGQQQRWSLEESVPEGGKDTPIFRHMEVTDLMQERVPPLLSKGNKALASQDAFLASVLQTIARIKDEQSNNPGGNKKHWQEELHMLLTVLAETTQDSPTVAEKESSNDHAMQAAMQATG